MIAPLAVHIADCIQHLTRMSRRYPRVRLSTVTRQARSRLEVIVYFLAVLELIKQQSLRALQERPLGEIYLEAREPDPEADISPLDLSDYGEEGAPSERDRADDASPAQESAPPSAEA